jgi:hypothetical protein
MEDHVQAIRDELDAIARIADPEERARTATRALQLMTRANRELALLRRKDVRAMHAGGKGRSYQEIGTAIGIDWTRVKDIEAGMPTGNSSRSRAAKPRAQADGARGR